MGGILMGLYQQMESKEPSEVSDSEESKEVLPWNNCLPEEKIYIYHLHTYIFMSLYLGDCHSVNQKQPLY